jgi:hypothetical protein
MAFDVSTDAELEQLRRCNRLMIGMLCHLITSGFNGRATISEELLHNSGSLQISHQVGGRLVLTVDRPESPAPQRANLIAPITSPV